jgi:hypothetical protein
MPRSHVSKEDRGSAELSSVGACKSSVGLASLEDPSGSSGMRTTSAAEMRRCSLLARRSSRNCSSRRATEKVQRIHRVFIANC